jgi:hypothetical protein
MTRSRCGPIAAESSTAPTSMLSSPMTRAPPAPPFARASPWPRSRPTATSACRTGHRSTRARSSARTDRARSSDVRLVNPTGLWCARVRSASGCAPRSNWRACSLPHATPAATAGCSRGAGWPTSAAAWPSGRTGRWARFSLTWPSRWGRAGILEAEPIGRTGGVIPVGGIVGPCGRLGRVRVLLAGDAAGLAHSVTGAGIAAAVLSGTLAGEAAAAAVSGILARCPLTRRSFAICLPALSSVRSSDGARLGGTRSTTPPSAVAGRAFPPIGKSMACLSELRGG